MVNTEITPIEKVMVAAAHEALLVLDEKLEVLALNERAHELLGDKAVVGTHVSHLMLSSELDATLHYVLENDETEMEVQTKLDNRFYRIRTYLHVESDNTKRIGLAVIDVTELVRLNRARRDMVANISHELRTPIANIRLIIDSLFHEAEKPKRKKSIESLHSIARETDSLLWLVQELLDLSMIESGQAILRMVDVPLEQIIEDTVEIMAEQAIYRETNLVSKVPEGLVVLCDKDLVRRVLINLIHNAMKYAPKDSDVTISAVNEGEYITLTVLDQGDGVPADQTERIFERFYQVDGSRSKREGTGLGLAICKHIVEAHGGHIWAEEAKTAGGGKFSFTLLNAYYED